MYIDPEHYGITATRCNIAKYIWGVIKPMKTSQICVAIITTELLFMKILIINKIGPVYIPVYMSVLVSGWEVTLCRIQIKLYLCSAGPFVYGPWCLQIS